MIEEILAGDIVASDESTVIAEESPQKEEAVNQEEQADGEEAQKKPSGAQRNKAKIARLEQKLAEAEAKLNAKPVDKEPQLNDYETYDAYNRATSRWEANQAIVAHEEKLAKNQTVSKEAEFERTWDDKIEALEEAEWEEYQNLVEDYKDIELRTQIIKSAQKSDIGPKILLHLDKNPELFDKLNSKDISDLTIIREIRNIESQLKNPSQKPLVKGSRSPAPINPVRGSSPTSVSLEDLDTDAYIAKRYPNLSKK